MVIGIFTRISNPQEVNEAVVDRPPNPSWTTVVNGAETKRMQISHQTKRRDSVTQKPHVGSDALLP